MTSVPAVMIWTDRNPLKAERSYRRRHCLHRHQLTSVPLYRRGLRTPTSRALLSARSNGAAAFAVGS